MKTIKDIEYLEGVKVIVRVDFNVPIESGKVRDDFRIRAILPTLNQLSKKGAKLILLSHIEAIDGSDPSLEPIANHLQNLGQKVVFIKDYKKVPEIVENQIKPGGLVLLENVRFFEGEKKNDSDFAKELASLGDIFVNDAFPVSHRSHASIVGIPQYLPSYIGLNFENEIKNLSKAFKPNHPFLFILGGAKFETKLPLIEKFLNTADWLFIGGALANDLLKAKGYNIGKSSYSRTQNSFSNLINQAKIILPIDVTLNNHSHKSIQDIADNDGIMDSGPKTLEMLGQKISEAKFILWNGPLGLYEDGFTSGTESLAKMIAEATKNRGIESIVGGGDTLAAIANLGIEDDFSFISSGGGAMLDYLAKGTLPGIEAIKESQG